MEMEIINDNEFKKLKIYKQHQFTNRYDHSIAVAKMAEYFAGLIHADKEKAYRAGLLHDFFFYDWHDDKLPENHVFYHPKVAAENAKKFSLSEEELDAIRSHMWPLGPLPKSKIAWCVTIADKICALEEACYIPKLKYIFSN